MKNISTKRLELVAFTAELLSVELRSPETLALLLHASVPGGWPPGEYDRSAMQYFYDRLSAHPELAGWYGWYALLKTMKEERPILVGAGGFINPPDTDGVLEIGYSILPAYEGQGIATEVVHTLIDFACMDKRVRKILAHTTMENIGSIKVLEKKWIHLFRSRHRIAYAGVLQHKNNKVNT